MPTPAIVATPNASNANSFLTLVEGQAYWDTRLWTDLWENSDDQSAALILATRTLVAMLSPRRKFVPPSGGQPGYYIISQTWTGIPATATQVLPWGRLGMFDRNGNAIAGTVIPQELKNATAELAGQMSKADRLIDNDVAVQGLTSVKAGSVALSFKSDIMMTKVLPDIVLDLLVPSWLTNQVIEPMYSAFIDIIEPTVSGL